MACTVHTVTVEPTLCILTEDPGSLEVPGIVIDVSLIGGHPHANFTQHSNVVTLLWPPPEPSKYSLIVDGHAEANPDNETARYGIVPTDSLGYCTAKPNLTLPKPPKTTSTTACCSHFRPNPPTRTKEPGLKIKGTGLFRAWTGI
ncbi:hypothetical protein [Mycobacterium uberis]|uniref:hypothetical protein n=1 Tax=Mycobacterium uberis TaxID=2162698 RepID=UPI00268622EB